MGRQQFSQPINVVSQSSTKVVYLATSSIAPVIINGSDSVLLYAPAKTIAEIIGVEIVFPPVLAATSGVKSIEVLVGTGSVPIVTCGGPWNQQLKIRFLTPEGSTTNLPTDLAAFTVALKGTSFDDTVPMTIRFWNNTNGAISAAEGERRLANLFTKVTAVN